MAKRKVRLSIQDPQQLLVELTRARAALKRSKGAEPRDCPQVDSLIVLLHGAEELLTVVNAPAPA